jgi:hypothetical protein
MKLVHVALIAALLAGACRGKNIESEPGPVYLLVVDNPMSHVMDVWYDDGQRTEELGRIEPGSSREFVIAGPAGTSIEVIGRDDGRTHTVTRPTELVRGSAVRVVLTP